MIRVEELSYGVPSKDLYKDVSFELNQGDHAALIGSNGTGKSTLADLLINTDDYLFDGKIIKADECRIGYASQFTVEEKSSDMTVVEYLSQKFLDVQEDIARACDEMATAEDMEAAFDKYQQLLDLNDSMDGDNYESNIHKQLYTAGMLDLKDVKISQISGGEYKVIQIVKEMLLAPNLLILDEPDVFLDFENLNSLVRLINSHKGTLLVITHNRLLLNHCFNKILHLEGFELRQFEGTYPQYRIEQFREKLDLMRQYVDEQEEIQRNIEMVERLRKKATLLINPNAGRQVNAKQSQLERLLDRQIDAPFIELREPEITLPQIELAEDTTEEPAPVLTVSDYSITFDDCLLDNVNFDIKPGEKVAIVGANGAGKTTLVRDIMNNDNPAISINPDVNFQCLSQLQGETIDGNLTVYKMLNDKDFGGETDIREHLSKYCLDEVKLTSPIHDLSIGEQNLLQIAAIENTGAELIIMDEPTSHLDVYTQTALESAINEYEGAVLMISHDFYLIAGCADYVLLMEDGTMRRTSARKFRKVVYDKFFDQKYLEIDRKRQALEGEIRTAFHETRLDKVESLINELEELSER